VDAAVDAAVGAENKKKGHMYSKAMPKRPANQSGNAQRPMTKQTIQREIRLAEREIDRQLSNIRKLKEMEWRLSRLGISTRGKKSIN